jgi:hypothetical protein
MKTSRAIGLTVVAGVGIAALMTYYFPDLDFGLGAGSRLGLPLGKTQTESVGIDAPDTETETQTTTVSDTSTEPTEPELVTPPAVVYVIIDAREYLLRRGEEGKAAFKPANLDEVIEAAQSATGDDLGIRIRIAQRSSSRETTERALRAKLEEAGIPGDSIRWRDEPVE